jgi:hypothetical protein
LADLNGDKILDILELDGDETMTLLGNGKGAFRQGPTSNIGVSGYFAVADMNGDGYPDVVGSGLFYPGDAPGVGVSFGVLGGTFQPAVFYPTADNELGPVAVGDFNGDGIPDVPCRLWRNRPMAASLTSRQGT